MTFVFSSGMSSYLFGSFSSALKKEVEVDNWPSGLCCTESVCSVKQKEKQPGQVDRGPKALFPTSRSFRMCLHSGHRHIAYLLAVLTWATDSTFSVSSP